VLKTYICPKYPGYQIGDLAHFSGGLFSTEDEGAQKAIESNDWFNIFVFDATASVPIDLPHPNTPVDLDRQEMKPVVHDRTNISDEDRMPPPEVQQDFQDPMLEYRQIPAWKIDRGNSAYLERLCSELGIPLSEDAKRPEMIRKLKEKLNLK